MKLLILTDGIAPFVIGGMQKHSFQLTKNLALLGHELTLVHCIYGKNAMPDKNAIATAFGEEAMRNIKVIGLRFPPAAWYPGHYIKESYIYSKFIYDKLRPNLKEFDFIYAKGFTAWYFLDQKKRGQAMPPIGLKFHGYEMLQQPANLKMRMHNWILRGPTLWNNKNADYVFSYGGKITEILRNIGVSDQRIIEIPTGIEQSWIAEKIPLTTTTRISFVFIGRFERRKGIEELSNALRELAETVDFEFHFIGPIPKSSQIKSPKIIYHGTVSDQREIIRILDQCQVITVPSHSEGMPNVIMEAMARGLAVLATDVGAVRSVVNNENGWFVEPGNTEQLKSTLLSIISMSPSTLKERREKSLQLIREYSWDKIALITASQIAKLLK